MSNNDLGNGPHNDPNDDIPVLRDAVARRPSPRLSAELIDEICDSISAQAWVLIDKLLAEALREAEETLRIQINDRLTDDLPALIESTLREKLGRPTE
jgi:hypothetical protein